MNPKLVEQLRTIASRGVMDDADVQILFDCADEMVTLRAYNHRLTSEINERNRNLYIAQDQLASAVQDARDWQDRAWEYENELREISEAPRW